MPGPSFGSDAQRRRISGRVGGIIRLVPANCEPDAIQRLVASLGPGGQVLSSEAEAFVGDFDACWMDGCPLETLADWLPVLRQDRLASVSGAFSVAWRKPGGTVCLARDPIGERGLFYAHIPGGLVFASTIQAILATGLIEPSLNLLAVARYLSYAYLPGAETLILGISKLLPGEVVEFRNGQLSSTRLWHLPPEGSATAKPDSELLRLQLRAELEAAVLRRLPPGEPVGAFLSGGIDSSLVVALARRLHNSDVFTYSVSFGSGYPNELSFSTLVAEHCRTVHRIVELSPEVVLRHLDESIALLSDPIGDPLTVPNALLFREAAREVNVVLNGEPTTLQDGATVESALVALDLPGAGRGVAVAVDAEVVPRGQWGKTALHEGARVEILRAIQGG